MASANSELESPRIGALLEGVTKDRRIRKCASVVVVLYSTFSHSKSADITPRTHHGCLEIDDSSNRLIFLIKNTQLSRSGPRAGAYRASRPRLVARKRVTIMPTCFLLTEGRCGTRLQATPHPDQ
jgi:hypothetical protein